MYYLIEYNTIAANPEFGTTCSEFDDMYYFSCHIIIVRCTKYGRFSS